MAIHLPERTQSSIDTLTLREIVIDPEAIDPEDAEMLAEMVQAAVNEGLRAAQQLAESKMGGITGGLGGLPGM